MDHNVTLISTIAAGFGMALVLGFIAERLKVPALVGYLLAGIVLGPGTPGFVADIGIASQLSEIGVMLLMFGVGLHFSLKDLLAVRRIAVGWLVVEDLATVLVLVLLPPLAGVLGGTVLHQASTSSAELWWTIGQT